MNKKMPQPHITVVEYVRMIRGKLKIKEIDLHEFGVYLRDVAEYFTKEDFMELENDKNK